MRHLPGMDGQTALCRDAAARPADIAPPGERFDCEACLDIVTASFQKSVCLKTLAARHGISFSIVRSEGVEPFWHVQLSKNHGEDSYSEDPVTVARILPYSEEEYRLFENDGGSITPKLLKATMRAARTMFGVIGSNLHDAMKDMVANSGQKNKQAASVFAELATDVHDVNDFMIDLSRIRLEDS